LNALNNKYSIIDIETTGMNREGKRSSRLSIINFDADTFEIEESFSSLINPEKIFPTNRNDHRNQ